VIVVSWACAEAASTRTSAAVVVIVILRIDPPCGCRTGQPEQRIVPPVALGRSARQLRDNSCGLLTTLVDDCSYGGAFAFLRPVPVGGIA
jgi:hypothetical protein